MTTCKLNLEVFNTPTHTDLCAFRKKVEKMPLKKVLPWLVALHYADRHDEAAKLHKTWTRDYDYDSHSHDCRWNMMHRAGVRVAGRDDVYFVAAKE